MCAFVTKIGLILQAAPAIIIIIMTLFHEDNILSNYVLI